MNKLELSDFLTIKEIDNDKAEIIYLSQNTTSPVNGNYGTISFNPLTIQLNLDNDIVDKEELIKEGINL